MLPAISPDGPTTAKRRLFLALEHPMRATAGGKLVCGVILAFIIANALLVCLPAEWTLELPSGFVYGFSIVSALVFACEYGLRIWTADELRPQYAPARARLRYVVSPMGIVDLLSWLPSIVMVFFPITSTLGDAISVIRLIRLIKISRYMKGLATIGVVMKKRRQEIVAAFMVLALLTVAASVLMYEAEHAAQPDAFDSIFTGVYWAMTTITTTGYGDLVPITALGRFVGFVVMVLSIAVVAIPAGIFSAGFVEEFRAQRKRDEDAADD